VEHASPSSHTNASTEGAQRRRLLMHAHAQPCQRARSRLPIRQVQHQRSLDAWYGAFSLARSRLEADRLPLRLRVVVEGISSKKDLPRAGLLVRLIPRAPPLQGPQRPRRRGCQCAGHGRRGARRSAQPCAISRTLPGRRLEGSAGGRAMRRGRSRPLRADTPQRSAHRRSVPRLRARGGCGWSN
jgi:hypothetical protein